MDGLAAYDPDDFLSIAIEDLYALAEDDLVPPAADGDELEEAVLGNVLDQETDFIHVAGDEDAGTVVGVGADDRAGFVCGEGADFPEFVGENGADLVFKAGNGMGFGQFLEKGYGFG